MSQATKNKSKQWDFSKGHYIRFKMNIISTRNLTGTNMQKLSIGGQIRLRAKKNWSSFLIKNSANKIHPLRFFRILEYTHNNEKLLYKLFFFLKKDFLHFLEFVGPLRRVRGLGQCAQIANLFLRIKCWKLNQLINP